MRRQVHLFLEDPTETRKMTASMRVDETFIRNLKKDEKGAQWALYVRGQSTIQVRVPFRVLEAKPKREDYNRFIQEDRAKYCVVPREAPPMYTPESERETGREIAVFRHGKKQLFPPDAPDESYFD